MAKWKQYELWVQTAEDKWEMVGQFPNAEVPTAMAKARSSRTRLIEVQYDGSRLLGQELVLRSAQCVRKSTSKSRKFFCYPFRQKTISQRNPPRINFCRAARQA